MWGCGRASSKSIRSHHAGHRLPCSRCIATESSTTAALALALAPLLLPAPPSIASCARFSPDNRTSRTSPLAGPPSGRYMYDGGKAIGSSCSGRGACRQYSSSSVSHRRNSSCRCSTVIFGSSLNDLDASFTLGPSAPPGALSSAVSPFLSSRASASAASPHRKLSTDGWFSLRRAADGRVSVRGGGRGGERRTERRYRAARARRRAGGGAHSIALRSIAYHCTA